MDGSRAHHEQTIMVNSVHVAKNLRLHNPAFYNSAIRTEVDAPALSGRGQQTCLFDCAVSDLHSAAAELV